MSSPDIHNAELKNLSRESMFEALCQLMQHRDYRSITVKDIVEKAGVSRMAYYRNYHSKEDILRSYFDRQFRQFLDGLLEQPDVTFYDLYLLFFRTFRRYKELLGLLDKAGLSPLLLEVFTDHLPEILQTLFSQVRDQTREYDLTYAAGGLYNLVLHWARNGMVESDSEMADLAIEIGWPKLLLGGVDPHSPIFLK